MLAFCPHNKYIATSSSTFNMHLCASASSGCVAPSCISKQRFQMMFRQYSKTSVLLCRGGVVYDCGIIVYTPVVHSYIGFNVIEKCYNIILCDAYRFVYSGLSLSDFPRS